MMIMTQKLRDLMEELKVMNSETFYHSIRVKNIVCKMIKLLNEEGTTSYTQEEIDLICKGALLHDVGKLYVDNVILTKESRLTIEEKECMTMHTNLGFEAIKGELDEIEYEMLKNIMLYHHERRDGNGYEKKTEYPLYVDVVAICDVFDALNSDRIYKKGFSKEKTIEIIKSGSSGFFDDSMIKCLEKTVKEID